LEPPRGPAAAARRPRPAEGCSLGSHEKPKLPMRARRAIPRRVTECKQFVVAMVISWQVLLMWNLVIVRGSFICCPFFAPMGAVSPQPHYPRVGPQTPMLLLKTNHLRQFWAAPPHEEPPQRRRVDCAPCPSRAGTTAESVHGPCRPDRLFLSCPCAARSNAVAKRDKARTFYARTASGRPTAFVSVADIQ
jgi:hypothetical protein